MASLYRWSFTLSHQQKPYIRFRIYYTIPYNPPGSWHKCTQTETPQPSVCQILLEEWVITFWPQGPQGLGNPQLVSVFTITRYYIPESSEDQHGTHDSFPTEEWHFHGESFVWKLHPSTVSDPWIPRSCCKFSGRFYKHGQVLAGRGTSQ